MLTKTGDRPTDHPFYYVQSSCNFLFYRKLLAAKHLLDITGDNGLGAAFHRIRRH